MKSALGLVVTWYRIHHQSEHAPHNSYPKVKTTFRVGVFFNIYQQKELCSIFFAVTFFTGDRKLTLCTENINRV
jgi:hypothetical protein